MTTAFRGFIGLGMVTLVIPVGLGRAADPPYRSPYRVEFREPLVNLTGDLDRTERGNPHLETDIPHAEWYARRMLAGSAHWGPSARHYPELAAAEHWSVERKRERVIAVALRFRGYAYQHHHIPDWDPPASWPWTPTCAGSNGRGVDCSNFTGFVYNLAFGYRLNTDVGLQAEEAAAPGPGPHRTTRLQRVELPSSFEERRQVLRTGDLLFIRGSPTGQVSHVVLWVGPIGRSPDGTPLILDSTGGSIHDATGQAIPCGIHLRPYQANSWYHASASHALRVFPDGP